MQICTPFKSLVWAYYRIYILLSTVGLWRYLVFRTSIRKALLWMWWINIVMQEIVSSLFNALFIHAENSQCIKNTFLESKEFNTMVLSYSHTTLFGTQRRCLLPWKWPRKSCTKRHTLLAILRYVSQVSKKTIEKKNFYIVKLWNWKFTNPTANTVQQAQLFQIRNWQWRHNSLRWSTDDVTNQ